MYLAISKSFFNFDLPTPSYQTGLLWVKKLGYFELNKPKEKASDWVIIADESIGIGQEKILVVLGIRLRDIRFTRPLKLQELTPLLVKSKESWKSADIKEQLEIVRKQIGTILYAVTDAGSALKKGLKDANIKHIHDITHVLAIVLERIYKRDPVFKDLTHQMGQMRLKLCCSKYAHLIPPNQRSKSRFLNVDIIAEWGMKALFALEKKNISIAEKKELLWIKEKKEFIVELNEIINIIKNVSVILKRNGLSKKVKKKCISILKYCRKGRMKVFRRDLIKYLDEHIKIIKKRNEKLLCCSDIIESTFGRYKNEINKNPMSGITDLALIIPAFTSDLTKETINKAIDSCSVSELNRWSHCNLCESLSIRRNQIYEKKKNVNLFQKRAI